MQLVSGGTETVTVNLAPESLAAIAAALESEIQLICLLRDELQQQRVAVSADDAGGVSASVESVSRTLLNIDTARQRRREALREAGLSRDLPLQDLERELGAPVPARLADAILRLQRAAREVARETTINRDVLRRAVENGEAFLQRLFAAADGPAPAYRPLPEERERTESGRLLNRRA